MVKAWPWTHRVIMPRIALNVKQFIQTMLNKKKFGRKWTVPCAPSLPPRVLVIESMDGSINTTSTDNRLANDTGGNRL